MEVDPPSLELQEIVLNEYTYAIRFANMVQEEQIRLVIKPKPKWITEGLWLKLASKFIIMKSKVNYGVDFGGETDGT